MSKSELATNAILGGVIGLGVGHRIGARKADQNHQDYDINHLSDSQKNLIKKWSVAGLLTGAATGVIIVPKITRFITSKLVKTAEMYYDKRKHLLHQYPEAYAPAMALSGGLGMYEAHKMMKALNEVSDFKELKDYEKAFKHGRWAVPAVALGLGAYYTRKKYMKKNASALKGALIGGVAGGLAGHLRDRRQNAQFPSEQKTHIRALINALVGASIGAGVGHGIPLYKRIKHGQV
jgi:hypothetical protein